MLLFESRVILMVITAVPDALASALDTAFGFSFRGLRSSRNSVGVVVFPGGGLFVGGVGESLPQPAAVTASARTRIGNAFISLSFTGLTKRICG
jgi:hypothetical protein